MGKKLHLSIRIKIMLGYIFVILCLGATIMLVMDRISARQEAINFITEHDIAVHNLLSEIENQLLAMETGQRGFVITGDTRYLDRYNEGNQQWLRSYNTLHQLLSDNAPQQRTLESIKPVIEHWVTNSGERVIALKRLNKADEITEYFKQDPGRNDMNQLRSQIESMRSAEKKLTEDRSDHLLKDYESIKVILFAILFIVSAISLLVSLFISGVIVKTINQVVTTVKRIAKSEGVLNERIIVSTKDEIEDLATATNELLDSLEEESWVQTRVTEVATMYQGIHHVNELSEEIITKLAPMFGASYGAVYLHKNHGGQSLYVKAAAYADSGQEMAVNSFKLGEGLVGQCALDKRLFLMKDIPDNYVKINSGLGKASPRSLLILPVMYEGNVEAVIELASFDEFDNRHVKLMEEIEGNLGSSIVNVLGRMEVERLLNESQMLTEELQAQSEELQAQSEELQMQQEQLRMSNEFLEEQNSFVEQKALELKTAKDELEEYSTQLERSSQYKSDFLANMSHELRTPLNSILILSQMLSENDQGRLTDEEEEYSRVIYSAGKDLLTLIDDILDLSKVEAGKIDIIADEVNLTELPQLLKLMFDPVAARKGIALHMRLDTDVPDVLMTDGLRLQQILKNLLSNAFKFTEQGSVTMRIRKAEASEVADRLSLEEDELVVAISVSDTGIGIPKDKQKLIFDAFMQADGTTNRQYGGTGLGLSICREFSKLLGGYLTVESEPGSGSTFTLFLTQMKETGIHRAAASEVAATVERPGLKGRVNSKGDEDMATSLNEQLDKAAVVPSAYSDEEDTSEGCILEGKKILLVDDDARNVFALVTALENKGIEVRTASQGRQAVDMLSDDPTGYDLVLMDIMMPIMDGYEAMQTIRRELGLKDLPIIALTAKAMKNARDQCIEAGASDYISKPLNMDQLFSLMRVWLTKQVKR
ncbi:MAG: response regulator [Paenibacillus sp.]|nr:response regulator [Paenibacillus sp.]